ncbi:molybdopterin oxidoreductase [Flavonifractor sp. HCP28S3_F3]|uniref:molybdopterin oxidoreductase n=1 Tax=Flavonifractor sp. HCP28S3_F3 TaxID=3438939 RepID=UPI003F8A713C
MKARDYLWCALNLMLDREETLARLCPHCRAEAEEERCPVCGMPTGETTAAHNASFDQERYERLKRGERI